MSLSLLLLLLGLSGLALSFRILIIPASDYPDIGVVGPEFLGRLNLDALGNSGILNGDPSCTSSNGFSAYLFGSVYTCANIILNQQYIFYAVIISLVFVGALCLSLVLFTPSHPFAKRLKLVPFFLLFLPSTYYYLIGLHTDVAYSFIGMTSVFALMCCSASNFSFSWPRRLPISVVATFLFLLALFLCAALIVPDSQNLILLFLFSFLLVIFWAPSSSLGPLAFLVHNLGVQSKRLLQFRPNIAKSLCLPLLLSIAIPLILSILSISVMQLMAGLPGPLGFVGTAYSTIYLDILTKYPLPFRIFNLLQTAVLRTPSLWGPSIFSWLFIAFSFIYGSLKMISCEDSGAPRHIKIGFLSSAFLVSCIVAVFQGYSNYKYFIALAPLMVLPFAYAPGISFLAISTVYIELLTRSLFST